MPDVSIAERHARIVLAVVSLVFAVASFAGALLLPVSAIQRPALIVGLAVLAAYGAGRLARYVLNASFTDLLRRTTLRVRTTHRALSSNARNRQLQLTGLGFSFSTPMVFVDGAGRVCIPPFSIASFPDGSTVAMVAGRFTYLLSALSDGRLLKTTKADPKQFPRHDAVELNGVPSRQPEAALLDAHWAKLAELAASGVYPDTSVDPVHLVELDEYYEHLALGGDVVPA